MRTLFLPLLLIAFAVASCLSPDPVETAIAEHDASIDECGGAKAALVLYINKIAQRIAAEEAYDPDADYDTLVEFTAAFQVVLEAYRIEETAFQMFRNILVKCNDPVVANENLHIVYEEYYRKAVEECIGATSAQEMYISAREK